MIKYKNLTMSFALLLMVIWANAQEGPKSFHKYCVVTSLTGGPGKAIYTTRDHKGEKISSDVLDSNIDPVITEYGLTDKIGIGITRGGDNFNVDANKFYKQNLLADANTMAVSTKYVTFDVSYHYFITKRLDFSVFTSAGYYKLAGYANSPYASDVDCLQPLYTYEARGGIIRAGARARWYFTKRFGLMAMLYGYKGIVKEPYRKNQISDGKGGGGITTTLIGGGSELGICFRIGKQKNVQPEKLKEKKKLAKRNSVEDSDKQPLVCIVWD